MPLSFPRRKPTKTPQLALPLAVATANTELLADILSAVQGQPLPHPDLGTPARKLHRRGSPLTSVVAAHSVDTSKGEQRVLEAVRSFGEAGCTQDDVLARYSDLPYSSVTARFAALLQKRYIVDTGKTKPGKSGRPQRIVRAAYYK
jgi:hypothetical protein